MRPEKRKARSVPQQVSSECRASNELTFSNVYMMERASCRGDSTPGSAGLSLLVPASVEQKMGECHVSVTGRLTIGGVERAEPSSSSESSASWACSAPWT